MNEELKKLLIVIVAFVTCLLLFLNVGYNNKKNNEIYNLVVFGDNIKTNYVPFIENNGMYISVDTISKTIDEEIYYDKVATKVIITTYYDLIKFKIDENKMSKNLEYIDINTCAKMIDGQPYIDINLVKDIYKIKVEYNEQTKTMSIDKLDTADIKVKYNKVKVYSDVRTDSDVIQILSNNNTVTVYTESLKHNRWYKVKTDSGVIGYIVKNSVDIPVKEDEILKEDNTQELKPNSKITMFWQYGSNLNTLGNQKVEGVNVVSPTWYELKNSKGDISSKYSAEYFNKAKSYGYDIWPIITNGTDSANYTADDTSKMLNSEYNRELFIKNILYICKNNKLDGINIDFERMKNEDKDAFTRFIRELAPILRKEKIIVSVDIYFVGYISRSGIGKASDYTILMGYDQRGNWSNEAGSISEINWVENNVKSLIEDAKIPSEKIILGVPFYTRMWTSKVSETKPTSKIYSMYDCQSFLKTNKLTTVWDEDAGQNYAEYKKGDLTYKLWIEDKESIKKRVETVNKYKLAGISGWQKGLETQDVWNVIKENLK